MTTDHKPTPADELRSLLCEAVDNWGVDDAYRERTGWTRRASAELDRRAAPEAVMAALAILEKHGARDPATLQDVSRACPNCNDELVFVRNGSVVMCLDQRHTTAKATRHE